MKDILLLLIGVFGCSFLFGQNLRIGRIELVSPSSKINLNQIFEFNKEFEKNENVLKPKWFKTCEDAEHAASVLMEKKKLYFINYNIDDTRVFDHLLWKRYRLKLLRVGHIKVENYSCFNDIFEEYLNRQYGYNVIDSTYLEAKELVHKIGVIEIDGILKTVVFDEILDNSLQLARFRENIEEDFKEVEIGQEQRILVKVAFIISRDGSLKNIELFSKNISFGEFPNLEDSIEKILKRQEWKSGIYRGENVPTITEIRLEIRN